MPRAVPEWKGKTDDTPVPDRVRARVRERQGNRCAITGREFVGGETIHYDHKIALKDGGANAEGNLQAVLVEPHKEKSALEAAVRAKVTAIANKHFDGKKPAARPIQSRGFPARKSRAPRPPLAPKQLYAKQEQAT